MTVLWPTICAGCGTFHLPANRYFDSGLGVQAFNWGERATYECRDCGFILKGMELPRYGTIPYEQFVKLHKKAWRKLLGKWNAIVVAKHGARIGRNVLSEILRDPKLYWKSILNDYTAVERNAWPYGGGFVGFVEHWRGTGIESIDVVFWPQGTSQAHWDFSAPALCVRGLVEVNFPRATVQ